jgi:predicted transcriptional regulator
MKMRKLMLKIEEDMKKRGIKKKDIALHLGVTSSAVTQYFKVEVPIDFIKFIKLLYFVYRSYPRELLLEYFSSNEIEIENIMLEWLVMNGKWDLLEELIKKGQDKKEFTLIYDIMLKRNRRQISPTEFLSEIEKIKFNYNGKEETENKILVNICSLYSYVDLHVYPLIPAVSELTLQQINMMDESYLKEAYEIRVKEIMVLSYMKRNKLKEAESIANEILCEDTLSKFPLQYNSVLCFLSEIYVFRDYVKSMYYINMALDMLKDEVLKGFVKREEALKATHDFIKIVNNDFTGLYLNDLAEKAHFLAMQDDSTSKEEALKILEKIEEENSGLTNFQLYYKALAQENISLMELAKDSFLKSGDLFYAQLPKRYLERNKIYG